MSFEDCPICLDGMQKTDFEHPLQCTIHCGYNFCRHCIESFISSSKDEYMEASDGNRHVKVSLQCPNCRSDLSHTIRDTLLLRKSDAFLNEYISCDGDSTKLTSTQLELKEALRQPEVQKAIDRARKLEAEYLGCEYKPLRDLPRSPSKRSSKNKVDDEEWGVEVDLDGGVHDSFRRPRSSSPRVRKELPKTKVDTSLFPGFDYFLTDEERFLVTDLMTRGDTDLLSEAAQILRSVANGRDSPPDKNDENKRVNPKTLQKRSSVFDLIAESEKAHHYHNVKETRRILGKPLTPPPARSAAAVRAMQHRENERDLKRKAQFKKLFPLPVRMPKVIEINLRVPFDMQFVDTEWNGTVMDAYSKLSMTYSGSITQKRPENRNIYTVLGELGSAGDIQIELPGQSRVVVREVGKEAGRQGAFKCDVVTHLNGESTAGMTSTMISEFVFSACQRGDETLIMTLNAERSVAEALKRRAIAIAAMW